MPPYTIILDLSNPRALCQWQATPDDLRTIFEHWLGAMGRLNIRGVRVVATRMPSNVREMLAASPKVEFVESDSAGPGAVQRGAAGVEGDIVLLTDGHFWLEDAVDALVEEHRSRKNRVTLCNFHAGFWPVITSSVELQKVPPTVRWVTRHLLGQIDVPGSGVAQIRRTIPDHNVYLCADQPDGWRAFAWVARSGRQRGQWKIPIEFRAGQVEVRENYRKSFGAMNVFRSLEGASVLEVGCSPRNIAGPRMLLEEFGIRQYTGVNLEKIYFDWRHPAATFHVGDALNAPFVPGSFDLVFSLAVWEHVQNPRALFHKIPQWLARGGGHFGQFQVWSASDGYHLPPAAFPGKRPPPYGHITMTQDQFRERLRENNPGEPSIDEAVRLVYEDGYINRVRASEFLEIIRTCGLEIVYLDGRSNGWLQYNAADAAKAAGNGYTAEELSVKGFEFYLRKSDFRLLDIPAPAATAR